jgi:hypothetical protein
MKALTEAGSLGGSKLNLKGTGWKTDGTSRSMDGDEVASGTDRTVISGTRLTPSKLRGWRHLSAWGWCVTGKRCSSSSRAREQRPTCPPLGCQRRRHARQTTRCRLLPGHGFPTSSSCGEEGCGTNPDASLPPWGEDVAKSAAAGRADDRRCRCRTAGEGVPCRSCCRGT